MIAVGIKEEIVQVTPKVACQILKKLPKDYTKGFEKEFSKKFQWDSVAIYPHGVSGRTKLI